MGFHAQNGKGTMYLVSPFGAEVNYGAVNMLEMLTLYNGQAFKNKKILLLKPAFLSESQKKAVHNAFNDSGKYSHAYNAILPSLILKLLI